MRRAAAKLLGRLESSVWARDSLPAVSITSPTSSAQHPGASSTAAGPHRELSTSERALTQQSASTSGRPGSWRWPHHHSSGLLGWADGHHSVLQQRGYKSSKRPMKPLNTTASRMAVDYVLGKHQQQGPAKITTPVIESAVPVVPEVPRPPVFWPVGVITEGYSLQTQPVFAVVEVGGTQFKVTTDDVIFVNRLEGVPVNGVLALGRVLMVGTRMQTVVGRPYAPGATVLAAVEEHFVDGKVHVFKMKKRKRYRKYQAPRPHLTTLRILGVRGVEGASEELAVQPLPVRWLDEAEGGTDNEDTDQQQAVTA